MDRAGAAPPRPLRRCSPRCDWHRIEERGLRRPRGQRPAPGGGQRGCAASRCSRSWACTCATSAGSWWPSTTPRFDPIWRECGRLGIPVAIHSGDPEAFFTPTDRHNERLRGAVDEPRLELPRPGLPRAAGAAGGAGPGDRPPPAHHVRGAARGRLAGEPRLRLRSCSPGTPTCTSSSGARQAELGRQPRRARQLLHRTPGPHPVRHRLLARAAACTPTTSAGWRPPTNTSRTLNHPEQGRWRIYGVELPDAVLEKIYHRNAERILGLTPR